MIIAIDHGYFAIKTRNCSFPAGITPFGDREPYTRQNVLTFGGCFFVCGSGRQPIQRDKTVNDNYYLLTLAAIAQELQARGAPREGSVTIAAGLPLTSYGREKPAFRKYLLRNAGQPTEFGYEGRKYRITIEDVLLFPQGFTALMTQPDLLVDEPSLSKVAVPDHTVGGSRLVWPRARHIPQGPQAHRPAGFVLSVSVRIGRAAAQVASPQLCGAAGHPQLG